MEKQDKEVQEKADIVMEMVPPQPLVYKLSYFDTRIGGEMIRLLFHKAGVPFEDKRIEYAEWESGMKSEVQWGKLPILEFEGNTIYSSTAIARFLAKRFSLAGRNEVESAKCDEIVDVCQDLRTAWGAYYYGNDTTELENKTKENLHRMIAIYLPTYNDIVQKNSDDGGGWLVGGGCTWADIFVANFFDVYEETIEPTVLDGFPALKAMKARVHAFPEIRKYVESRQDKNVICK